MSASTRFWLLLAALVAPQACSSDDRPPTLGTDEPTSGSAGTSSRSGSSNGEPGGEGPVGGGGGGGQPSGGASDGPIIGEVGGEGFFQGDGGAPPNPTTICDRDAEWTSSPLEGVNTAADERLLAMTPDEKTLVFSRDDELFVLDDAQATSVLLPGGYTHTRGVSLTADGLSLIVVTEDGAQFAEVSRGERGVTFAGAPSAARFESLNAWRVTAGGSFFAPALSVDEKTLYYTLRQGQSVANVWRARGESFSERRLQDIVTLGTEDGKAKLVVGVSADERTLFVLDEALGHVTGLWSATPLAEFTGAVQFDGFESVIPSEACDRIYGTTELDGSLDIVTGARK